MYDTAVYTDGGCASGANRKALRGDVLCVQLAFTLFAPLLLAARQAVSRGQQEEVLRPGLARRRRSP